MLPKFVKKSWGWEYWFCNVKEVEVMGHKETFVYSPVEKRINYCGKLLFVEHDKWSSNGKHHYHKEKDETFMVLEGNLIIDYVDSMGNPRSIYLNPLDSFRIKPGTKHRFTSVSKTGCKFIEVSTFHSDSDSYRCQYNTETGEWDE